MDRDKTNAELKDDRATGIRSADEEAWKTRVYENDLARMTRKHTWIGEEDDAAKLNDTAAGAADRHASVGGNTGAAGRAANEADGLRETRIFSGSQTDARYTRQYIRPEIDPPLREQRTESIRDERGTKTAGKPFKRISSMRKVRIGDRRRFKRLIAVLAVTALIILLEAGFFIMDARVKELPDEIKNVNKQTEDVLSDNKKLQKDNKKMGDRESKEEQKASWERLRDKVKEAVGETSS